MNKELKLTRVISANKQNVFESFIKPRIVEKWAVPDGMTLKIPQFEAKRGGVYRYEHTSDKGVYTCNGFFKDFLLNEKLVQIDTVKDPEGKVIFDNLETVTEFKAIGNNETELTLTLRGFNDEKSMNECEQGWTQSLDKLDRLFEISKRLDDGDQYSTSQSV